MFARLAICVCAAAALSAGSVFNLQSGGYLGGLDQDQVTAMALDSAGNVYVTGWTTSTAWPSNSLRAYAGNQDAFVIKFNPAANSIQWSTLLGGSGNDPAHAITVDAAGNVTIAGYTSSTNFPSSNARAGWTDGYVARFSPAGALLWAKIVGTAGDDQAHALALGPSGSVWTAGDAQGNAFAARFDSAGTQTAWKLIGGSTPGTKARGIAVDAAGEVYLTGETSSPDFPVVGVASALAGAPDAFVVRLSADGQTIRYSRFLGGAAREVVMPESGNAIAVDASGNAWVAGTTSALAFPHVAPIKATYTGGNTDAFVAKISPAGEVLFSTYLGTETTDEAYALALHPDGSVLVGGTTTSGPKPGTYDGVIWKLNPALTALVYTAYIAGSQSDVIHSLLVRDSTLYAGGMTQSNDAFGPAMMPAQQNGFAVLYQEGQLAVQISPADRELEYTVAGADCSPGTYIGTKVLPWKLGSFCTVTIANPQTNSTRRRRFTKWWDNSTANPRVFHAVEGLTLVMGIQSTTEYILRLGSEPAAGGTVIPSPDTPDRFYAAGSSLTLTAVPAAGYAFTGWNGGTLNTNPWPRTVVGNMNYYATFACAYSLAADRATAPEAGADQSVSVVAGAGCAWSAASNASWITVLSAASGVVTYRVGRNDTGANRVGTLLIAGRTFTVEQGGAQPPLAVTIGTSPAGVGWTVTGNNCAPGAYTGQNTLTWIRNAVCTVAADPSQNSGETRRVFVNWSDGSTANPRTLVASTPLTLTANYRREHHVVARANPAHGGSITPSDTWVAEGSAVQFIATPSAGFQFNQWTAGFGGFTPVQQWTVTAPLQVYAEFTSTCSAVPDRTRFDVASSGTYQAVFVAAAPNCTWTATATSDWLQVFPLTGTGSGFTYVRVYPNFRTRTRSGELRINSNRVVFDEAASSQRYEERLAGLMYFNYLGRLASPEEATWHANNVRRGLPAADMVLSFFNSIEFGFGGRFIAGLYVGMLLRDAEFGGWLFQRNAYTRGSLTQEDLVSNFINSAEYQMIFGKPTVREFVILLYRHILGREPAESEITFQMAQITRGLTREQLAGNFLNGVEFRNSTGPRLTAFLLYSCMLLRDGTPQEKAALAARIGSGTAIRTLLVEFMEMEEFKETLR